MADQRAALEPGAAASHLCGWSYAITGVTDQKAAQQAVDDMLAEHIKTCPGVSAAEEKLGYIADAARHTKASVTTLDDAAIANDTVLALATDGSEGQLDSSVMDAVKAAARAAG